MYGGLPILTSGTWISTFPIKWDSELSLQQEHSSQMSSGRTQQSKGKTKVGKTQNHLVCHEEIVPWQLEQREGTGCSSSEAPVLLWFFSQPEHHGLPAQISSGSLGVIPLSSPSPVKPFHAKVLMVEKKMRRQQVSIQPILYNSGHSDKSWTPSLRKSNLCQDGYIKKLLPPV